MSTLKSGHMMIEVLLWLAIFFIMKFPTCYAQDPLIEHAPTDANVCSKLALVITSDCLDDLWKIKELVGSIHKIWTRKILIIILVNSYQETAANEIGIIDSVNVYQASSYLFGVCGNKLNLNNNQSTIKAALQETRKRFDVVPVWISSDYSFQDKNKGSQFLTGVHSEHYWKVEDENLRLVAMTAVVGDSKNLPFQVGLVKNVERQRCQNFCHLKLRSSVVDNILLVASGTARAIQKDERTRVALLVPSKNKSIDFQQTPLLATLLKSFLTSLTSEDLIRFTYTFYIGYDKGDPILDQKQMEFRQTLQQMVKGKPIEFRFQLLPQYPCVTLFWNVLYRTALEDGNFYFYQLNDDVEILDPGWTGEFVRILEKRKGLGVVAPNDVMWNCRLYTQSFVSVTHFEIFGYYFPLEIKDWYSDNWITEIYGSEYSTCCSNSRIKNISQGQTRYSVCRHPDWKDEVSKGKLAFQSWRNENQER